MKDRGFGRIYRRGKIWWVEYWFRGQQYRESSKSSVRNRAVNLLRRRQAEMGRGMLVGQQAERLTFEDLARMVLDDYQVNARKSAPPLVRLREHFGHSMAIDITPDRVTSYIQKRVEERAAAATIKNEVAVLGRGFTLAYRAGRLPQRPPLPTIRVNNARTGFFSDAEVQRVIANLPAYLQTIVEAAYITGWRRGELIRLQWSQVDWESGSMRLERGTTKSGEPRSFPFSAHPRLTALLQEQRERTDAVERANDSLCPWVFHRNGQQVKGWYYDAWRTACKKAGVPERLLHDLRRSAVRNLVRAGVSEQVAMTLTGHKTRSVFDRYHIVSSTDQLEAVRKLAVLHGASVPEPRKVVAIGEAREMRTRTVPAQFGPSTGSSRTQLVANGGALMASPTGFEPVSPP